MISDLIGKKFVTKHGVRELVAHVGDADPVEHDGGLVWRYDGGSIYGDVFILEYVKTHSDENGPYKMMYSVDITGDLLDRFDWFLYDQREELEQFADIKIEELKAKLSSFDSLERALGIEILASYWGWLALDEEPDPMTAEDLESYWFTEAKEPAINQKFDNE